MLTASVLKLNIELRREASTTQLLRCGFGRVEEVVATNSDEVFSQDAHLRSIQHGYEGEMIRMRALIDGLFYDLGNHPVRSQGR
jgi:hypothetical protein